MSSTSFGLQGFQRQPTRPIGRCPEQMELAQAEEFLRPYGITKDALISRMGGSP